MTESIRTMYGKNKGVDLKMIVILYNELEYAEALVEHLSLRFNWGIVMCDKIDQEAEEADLILAEEGWFEQLRNRDELWNKTVFLLEEQTQEIPLIRNEFPYLVWKYDGFAQIRQRIAEAMEAKCGKACSVNEEEPPMIIVGGWYHEDCDAWVLARALADQIKNNVLYLNLEKFRGEDMKASLEMSYSLEDLLYYVLDRLQVEGIDPYGTIRSILDVRDRVCSLPRFDGYNPLLRLREEQWKLLLPSLCQASEAAAIFLWTGREELDHCSLFGGKVLRCIYIKPGDLSAAEGKRWERMKAWMEDEGEDMIRTEVHMADSWTEAFETIAEYGRELA